MQPWKNREFESFCRLRKQKTKRRCNRKSPVNGEIQPSPRPQAARSSPLPQQVFYIQCSNRIKGLLLQRTSEGLAPGCRHHPEFALSLFLHRSATSSRRRSISAAVSPLPLAFVFDQRRSRSRPTRTGRHTHSLFHRFASFVCFGFFFFPDQGQECVVRKHTSCDRNTPNVHRSQCGHEH